jgi:predicted kinase
MAKSVLILVCGLPGSGKSFFAKRLSDKIQASYLNSDLLRKEMFPVHRSYSEEEKKLVYDRMLHTTEAELVNQKTVVIDATFYKNSLRISFYQLAEKLNTQLYIFHIEANETLIKERTSVIRPDSEADFSVYLKLKPLFEPIDRPHSTLISEGNNIEELLSSALTYLYHGEKTT